jgi:hypothetical protein
MSTYIDDGKPGGGINHSWAEFTHARLLWLYGPERAASIIAGTDPATNTDLASWNRLGGVTVASVRGVR